MWSTNVCQRIRVRQRQRPTLPAADDTGPIVRWVSVRLPRLGDCTDAGRCEQPPDSSRPSRPSVPPASPRRHPAPGLGGPGYPSTGSLTEYYGTFGPLQRHWNLLLVDNRGTGGSGLIRCPGLDGYHTAARPPVHASDLFGTAYAVQDLRAVLQRLGLRRVDLYGDSYGSWFAQAFAARFPHVLRSVTLDSTYAIRHLDPYYASTGSSRRAALDRVCERDPGCTAATLGDGSAVARLAGSWRGPALPVAGDGRRTANAGGDQSAASGGPVPERRVRRTRLARSRRLGARRPERRHGGAAG